MADDTLLSCLDRAAESDEGIRFVSRDERANWVRYSEILERARRVAIGIAASGIEKGDRVAIALPSSVEFFEAFFGSLLAGAVPVPLSHAAPLGARQEHLRRTAALIQASRAGLVVTSPRLQRSLATLLNGVSCTSPDALPRDGELARAEPPADALALIQFSSGSAANPKPVSLTHRQILFNVRLILNAILDAYPERGDRKHAGVSWLPLYHDMGLVGCVFTALAHAAPLTLIPPDVFVARPSVWLRSISRYRGTISAAPNFAYRLACERIGDDRLEGVDLSSWCIALNGSELASAATMRRFAGRFASLGFRGEAFTPVYGMAEAALAVTFAAPCERYRSSSFDRRLLAARGKAEPEGQGLELVSVGRPLPGFELRIEDKNGKLLPEGSLGRIRVKGPSVMSGYFGRSAETREVLKAGWLDTGDMGFFHGGELYLYTRAKDVIVMHGRNHAPEDIEQAVDGLEGVRGVAAVGVPGSDGEELVVVAEAKAAEHGPVGDRIPPLILERTGLRPHEVVLVESLPRTSSGKLRRAEIQRRYLAGELSRFPG